MNKYNLTDEQINVLMNVSFIDAAYGGLSFASRDAFVYDLKTADLSCIMTYGDLIKAFGTWTYFKEVFYYFSSLSADRKNSR